MELCPATGEFDRERAELRKSLPKLQLNFQPVPSFSQAIALVQADRAAFAISSLLNNVSSDLTFRPFAYDGLAVFVAFSYARRLGGTDQL